ncbi:MAG: SDR family oxidoreductase [Saprospiraceae bacterium]|nr:SDR family oxidoreductase [Saprospiraceae bacterium]
MKNILITGAAKGLGLEITKVLLNQEGTKIYGLNRKLTEEYKGLMDLYPDRVFFLECDLSDIDSLRDSIFKNYISKGVAINGFVNNAAMAYDDIVTNMKLEPLESMYRVNVFAPMMLTKYVIRNMLLHKIEGSIVHISSISVHTGYKGLAMYASTKGALEAFSKNTAREWGSLKIRSNALVAGFMETDMSASLDKDQKNRIYNRTSLKVPTETKSVADTVSFLLSDQAKSITGQNIFVDSGTI